MIETTKTNTVVQEKALTDEDWARICSVWALSGSFLHMKIMEAKAATNMMEAPPIMIALKMYMGDALGAYIDWPDMTRVLIDNDSKTMERSQRHKGIIASQQVIFLFDDSIPSVFWAEAAGRQRQSGG